MYVSKKILIVDAAESNRTFLRHILTSAGYTVESANNSIEALEMVDEYDYDVFIIDIHLPELDGIKFIRALHKIEDLEIPPLLAAATKITDAIRKKGEAEGIIGWIHEPISPPDVLNLLKKIGLTNGHVVQSLA